MNWKLWNRRWHANLGIACALTLGAIAVSCPFIAHKPEEGTVLQRVGKALMTVHYGEFLPKNLRWIWIDTQGVVLGFLIGSGWFMHHRVKRRGTPVASDDPSAPGSSVAILHEAKSPAAVEAARALASDAESRGLRAFVCSLESYPLHRVAQERWLVLVADAAAETGVQRLAGELTRLGRQALRRVEYSLCVVGRGANPATNLTACLGETGATPLLPTAFCADESSARSWRGQFLSRLHALSQPA